MGHRAADSRVGRRKADWRNNQIKEERAGNSDRKDRLFLETDDSDVAIETVYARAADVWQLPDAKKPRGAIGRRAAEKRFD